MPSLYNIPIAELVDDNKQVNPTWLNWFNAAARLIRLSPSISKGIIAPTSTPEKVGDMYVDTVLSKVYISTGVLSASDWKIMN